MCLCQTAPETCQQLPARNVAGLLTPFMILFYLKIHFIKDTFAYLAQTKNVQSNPSDFLQSIVFQWCKGKGWAKPVKIFQWFHFDDPNGGSTWSGFQDSRKSNCFCSFLELWWKSYSHISGCRQTRLLHHLSSSLQYQRTCSDRSLFSIPRQVPNFATTQSDLESSLPVARHAG